MLHPDISFEAIEEDAHCMGCLQSKSFDFVTCQTLLMHVEHPVQVLKEMRRLCSADGFIVLSEPINTINRSMAYHAMALLPPRDAAVLLETWACFSMHAKRTLKINYDIALEIPALIEQAGLPISALLAYKNPRMILCSPTRAFESQFSERNRAIALGGGLSTENWERAKGIAAILSREERVLWVPDGMYLFVLRQ